MCLVVSKVAEKEQISSKTNRHWEFVPFQLVNHVDLTWMGTIPGVNLFISLAFPVIQCNLTTGEVLKKIT
jgi:hypothetical protein